MLHRLPEFVDDPVRFVVLIDEHLGTEVPVERTGDLELAAYIGEVVQFYVEMYAEQLSFAMGVPAAALIPEIWQLVEYS